MTQSTPDWPKGYVPTAQEWGTLFAAKQDELAGEVATLVIQVPVNFSVADTDFGFDIPFWTGFHRYVVSEMWVSEASADISEATVGLFSGVDGSDISIIPLTAITVTASSDNLANSCQKIVPSTADTRSYNLDALYVRVGSNVGATAIVSVVLKFLS